MGMLQLIALISRSHAILPFVQFSYIYDRHNRVIHICDENELLFFISEYRMGMNF